MTKELLNIPTTAAKKTNKANTKWWISGAVVNWNQWQLTRSKSSSTKRPLFFHRPIRSASFFLNSSRQGQTLLSFKTTSFVNDDVDKWLTNDATVAMEVEQFSNNIKGSMYIFDGTKWKEVCALNLLESNYDEFIGFFSCWIGTCLRTSYMEKILGMRKGTLYPSTPLLH